jgi:squalene-hopene/tetraprenyl-beta-curcumene cyclase
MRRTGLYICLLLAVTFAWMGLRRVVRARAAGRPSHASYLPTWSAQAAADYLDRREVWWQDWPMAKMDHETICISCHTVVPYAMIRSTIGQGLRETGLPVPEKVLMTSVETRVGNWSEMAPFYSDAVSGPGKTAESHATEAVLNAVILATYDARQGHLRPITRTALDAAWALQLETSENAGGWQWQDFQLAPWESPESAYQGAAMLALAVGNAPDQYASEPAVREYMARLRDYLRRQYAAQPLMSQAYVLWASPKVPGLLTEDEQKKLLDSLQSLQQADGGWSLSSLGKWQRIDDTSEPVESDGLATALVVLAMERSGTNSEDPTLKRGLAWLEQHQDKNGNWRAASLNRERDPKSNVGLFMSDAATGYAVLALDKAP